MRSIKFSFVFVSVAVAALMAAPSARLPKRHQEWLSGPVSLLNTKHKRQAFQDLDISRATAGSVEFPVLGAQDDPAPVVISRGGTDTPRWIAVNQYERALCWLAQDRPSEAVTSLEASWKLVQNPVTKGLLQHLYERTGQKSKSLN